MIRNKNIRLTSLYYKKYFLFSALFSFANLLEMLLIIVRLKGGTFLFLGGRSSPKFWLFYTACVGAHFRAVEWDNGIWIGTLSRVSGFLWHGSKWARRFVRFLSIYARAWTVSMYQQDFNYVITTLPPLSPEPWYVMRFAIWYQSLFGICLVVRTHANAC